MMRFFVFSQGKSFGNLLRNKLFVEHQNNCKKIHHILFVLALLLTIGLSSCNFYTETPTMAPAEIQNTAVSAAWTMVQATLDANPTATQPPLSETPTPLPTFTPPPLIPTLEQLVLPTSTSAPSDPNNCTKALNVGEAGPTKIVHIENTNKGRANISLNLYTPNLFGQCGSLSYSVAGGTKTKIAIPSGSWYAYAWVENPPSTGSVSFFTGPSETQNILGLVVKANEIELISTSILVPTKPPTSVPSTKTPTAAFATDPTQIALGTPGKLCNSSSYDPATVDVTIVDSTQITSGHEFVKTWKIKNTGVCPWGDGYGLIYAGYADKMSGEPVPLGTLVEAGQEIEVSVNFKAPTKVGEYISAWQMANTEGFPFGKAILVKIVVKADEVGTSTPEATSVPLQTPNPTQTLQAAFSDIDSQFKKSLKGNIAFNKPEQMKKDETTSIELILSPSLSQPILATQLVDQGGFVTSTVDSNLLLSPSGGNVSIETSQIEITQRMKATLKSQDPDAFVIEEMLDNAEQVVSSVNTTTWRWSVTAKKEGPQTLELVIYQLIKYDGKDYWTEVETYKANIVVEVTAMDRVKSWNWYSIIGAAVAVVGSVLGAWKWLDERKKKAAEEKSVQSSRKKKK